MSDDKRITVERTINASSDAVFDVLSNPARHPELDGSGFIRSDEGTDRIQGTGDVFTMNMSGDHMGGEQQGKRQGRVVVVGIAQVRGHFAKRLVAGIAGHANEAGALVEIPGVVDREPAGLKPRERGGVGEPDPDVEPG